MCVFPLYDFHLSFLTFNFIAAAAAAKSLQSCPTLCDPIDGSPPGSPVPGVLQALAVYGVAQSRTRLSDFIFTFHFQSLEKEMATHSSVLAWRIPGTGGLVGCHLRGRTESDTTDAT